jgi:chromatin remodeling complex protein RSC6
MLKLLQTYGYNLTYDNFILLLDNKIIIDSIEDYNFTFDNKYYDACSKLGFIPFKVDIPPTSSLLEKECTFSGNIHNIKDYIKKGVKPTQICMQNLCKNKNANTNIKYLLTQGVEVDLESLKNSINIYGGPTLKLLITEFEKYFNKHYVKNIIPVVEPVNNKEILNNNIEKEIVDDIEKEIVDDIEKEIVDDIEKEIADDIKNLSEDLNNIGKKKTKKVQTKKIKTKKITINKNIIKNINKNNDKKYDMIQLKNNNIKIEPKKIYNINNDFGKLIGINNTPFINLRKKVINYINKNNLYDKDNSIMIKIDKNLASATKLKEDSFINFDEIDNFIISQIVIDETLNK